MVHVHGSMLYAPGFKPVTPGFRLQAHHCFGSPFLSLGGLLSTGASLSNFYLFVELGLLLYPFPAFIWGELDQLCMKRNQHTCLK